ncbi:DUF6000 family protein [Streptomyces microflavus]|uniref:DUF6000 family protein n=1 Tax=Streptomyces microflavus TaxID=1919 RepID=UPI003D9EDC4E
MRRGAPLGCERRTAAWFAAVSRSDHFRERLGGLLLESEVCCAGGAVGGRGKVQVSGQSSPG